MTKNRTSRREWMTRTGSMLTAAALPLRMNGMEMAIGASQAAAPAKTAPTPEDIDRARRMKWWHEARFGMFIGVYTACWAGMNG